MVSISVFVSLHKEGWDEAGGGATKQTTPRRSPPQPAGQRDTLSPIVKLMFPLNIVLMVPVSIDEEEKKLQRKSTGNFREEEEEVLTVPSQPMIENPTDESHITMILVEILNIECSQFLST